VLIYVLGAPGSGKTTLTPLLQDRLSTHVVLDWDAFMDVATNLSGRDVRRNPDTWPSYRNLVRAIVESIQPHPMLLLGVCTPGELADWPIDDAVLLDCSDEQRKRRLSGRSRAEISDAVSDGRQYRALGLPVIDTTHLTPQEAATALAELIAHP
jgi:cytidylate kinase